MRIRPVVPVVATLAVLLLSPPPTALAAAALDQACSNGPYSQPSGNGTVHGCTTRVSQTSTDGDPDGTSQRPRISEDGQHVVFQSAANNLTPNSPHSGTHVFESTVSDPAGTISLVDVGAGGAAPNGTGTFVDVSGDGRLVVFQSTATNLVAGKTTRASSVFVRDMQTGTTVEVPHSSTGGETNGYSTRPTISAYPDASGNYYVTYNSKGTNLVAGASHVDDVYVTRVSSSLAISAPMLISHTPGHPTGASNGQNEHAEISSFGEAIVWQTTASNLGGASNGKFQVYESGNPFLNPGADPVLESVSTAGALGNGPSTRPAIDGHGDEIAFESTSSNLVSGDTNGALDSFARGTKAGAFVGDGVTVRVSLGPNGQQLTGATQRPNLDGAGDLVAFAANSHAVIAGDRNGQRDVFVRNLGTGRNTLVDVSTTGGFGGSATAHVTPKTGPQSVAVPLARGGGSDLSSRAFLSYDGKTVAFISGMSNLVPTDGNASSSLDDIFVRTFD